MRSIDKRYVFIAIQVILGIIWILLPEINNPAYQNCYEQLVGRNLSYQTFNKYQFYFFTAGNFLFFALLRGMNYKTFIFLELLLLIPVVIKFYVYICSK